MDRALLLPTEESVASSSSSNAKRVLSVVAAGIAGCALVLVVFTVQDPTASLWATTTSAPSPTAVRGVPQRVPNQRATALDTRLYDAPRAGLEAVAPVAETQPSAFLVPQPEPSLGPQNWTFLTLGAVSFLGAMVAFWKKAATRNSTGCLPIPPSLHPDFVAGRPSFHRAFESRQIGYLVCKGTPNFEGGETRGCCVHVCASAARVIRPFSVTDIAMAYGAGFVQQPGDNVPRYHARTTNH